MKGFMTKIYTAIGIGMVLAIVLSALLALLK